MTDNHATPKNRPEVELSGTIADVLSIYESDTHDWLLALLFTGGEYMVIFPPLQDAINRLLGCRINTWPGRKLCISVSEGESDGESDGPDF